MNLKNWNREHTIGLLLGLATIIVAIPVVILILSAVEDRSFSYKWGNFRLSPGEKSRVISLAAIVNLLWFHLSMKNKKWNKGMGVILATMLVLIVSLYLKFIA